MSENRPATKSCFLISPIGAESSDVRKKADDFYNYIINRVPALAEYKVTRADQIPWPGRITSQIIGQIATADLVIADVTGSNPNVYYEVALRHGLGKPIIICAAVGTELPFDTRDHRTIFYDMHIANVETVQRQISAQIEAINEAGYIPHNPISDAGLVIQLQNNNTPEANAAKIIVEQILLLGDRIGSLERRVKENAYIPYKTNTLLTEGLVAVEKNLSGGNIGGIYSIAEKARAFNEKKMGNITSNQGLLHEILDKDPETSTSG